MVVFNQHRGAFRLPPWTPQSRRLAAPATFYATGSGENGAVRGRPKRAPTRATAALRLRRPNRVRMLGPHRRRAQCHRSRRPARPTVPGGPCLPLRFLPQTPALGSISAFPRRISHPLPPRWAAVVCSRAVVPSPLSSAPNRFLWHPITPCGAQSFPLQIDDEMRAVQDHILAADQGAEERTFENTVRPLLLADGHVRGSYCGQERGGGNGDGIVF